LLGRLEAHRADRDTDAVRSAAAVASVHLVSSPSFNTSVSELRASSDRLRTLVEQLDDAGLERSAYPSEWSIADVLSHIGSSAVIMQRRLEDTLAGREVPDDFAPGVWDTWKAKSASAKADDALVADSALIETLAALTGTQIGGLELTLGPLTMTPNELIGLRLNEHALHTWDTEVALHPDATLPTRAAALVVDNLGLIARFTAKPSGVERTIVVRTTDPARTFTITLTPDAVEFTTGDADAESALELPAEAFARLVYGRLDPDRTPEYAGGVETLDELRRTYPGP
jgi:uncharacterized protein (TIGR03083 family)